MREPSAPADGARKAWRYFPELLRGLERAPGPGAPCMACSCPTERLVGPRAVVTWCPDCWVLSVEGAGARGPAIFTAAGRQGPPEAGRRAPPGISPQGGIA